MKVGKTSKFADGQYNRDERAYRREVEDLSIWCHDKNLSPNVNKTKEIIVDFRKIRGNHIPISINGSPVKIVDCFRSWRTHLTHPRVVSQHQLQVSDDLTGLERSWCS